MASLLLSTFEQIFDAASRTAAAARLLSPDTVAAELVAAARRSIDGADDWLSSGRVDRCRDALLSARTLLCDAARIVVEPDPAARPVLRAVWHCTHALASLERIVIER